MTLLEELHEQIRGLPAPMIHQVLQFIQLLKEGDEAGGVTTLLDAPGPATNDDWHNPYEEIWG